MSEEEFYDKAISLDNPEAIMEAIEQINVN